MHHWLSGRRSSIGCLGYLNPLFKMLFPYPCSVTFRYFSFGRNLCNLSPKPALMSNSQQETEVWKSRKLSQKVSSQASGKFHWHLARRHPAPTLIYLTLVRLRRAVLTDLGVLTCKYLTVFFRTRLLIRSSPSPTPPRPPLSWSFLYFSSSMLSGGLVFLFLTVILFLSKKNPKLEWCPKDR